MSNVPAPKAHRLAVRLYAALVVAVVAGTVVVLHVSATADIARDPQGAAILITAGLWLPQQLITAACYGRP